ncbi:hypothetical protein TNCV_2281041 [Trichonephila clavipes]|nr:hypothetical protein TNCV_2281041 [Trichonephila clavipes]
MSPNQCIELPRKDAKWLGFATHGRSVMGSRPNVTENPPCTQRLMHVKSFGEVTGMSSPLLDHGSKSQGPLLCRGAFIIPPSRSASPHSEPHSPNFHTLSA